MNGSAHGQPSAVPSRTGPANPSSGEKTTNRAAKTKAACRLIWDCHTRRRCSTTLIRSMRLVPIVRGAGVDRRAAPTATSAGIGASSITFLTTGRVFSTSSSGTSNTSSSCTCSSIWALSFCFASAASMRTMARRMMSAAVPCSRALMAARSLKARIEALELTMSG